MLLWHLRSEPQPFAGADPAVVLGCSLAADMQTERQKFDEACATYQVRPSTWERHPCVLCCSVDGQPSFSVHHVNVGVWSARGSVCSSWQRVRAKLSVGCRQPRRRLWRLSMNGGRPFDRFCSRRPSPQVPPAAWCHVQEQCRC
jgi:hypothetical protein